MLEIIPYSNTRDNTLHPAATSYHFVIESLFVVNRMVVIVWIDGW